MSKIYSLKIRHFRGISDFEQTFGDQNCVVLIGRGDSGKTTILKAISCVLSPIWNTTFTDLDFTNRDTSTPILIEAVILDAPEELFALNKYGEYYQLLKDGTLTSDIEDENADQSKKVLKVRLFVDDSLMPQWMVVSDREIGEKVFAHGDRAKLNMFMISDYVDNHFAYSKGSPLYSTLRKSLDKDNRNAPDKRITEIVRSAYEQIKGSNVFEEFDDATNKIKENAQRLGLTLDDLKTILEFKDNAYSESSLSLHSEDIPFRLRGKGSKRLLSIAIQYGLAEEGGIVLIDEIEQGLESDRARNLARLLARSTSGQVFITTHSKDVILEPKANQLFLMQKGASHIQPFDETLQGTLRAKPEAFFAKKIISCEGATEEGIIRAFSDDLQATRGYGIAVQGIVHIDGSGHNKFYKYAITFNNIGIKALVFCDDDNRDVDEDKDAAIKAGVKVVLCEKGNAIEQQLFNDLPWEGVCDLIKYAVEEHGAESILKNNGFEEFDKIETATSDRQTELRIQFGNKAKSKQAWFKSINHGEFLGRTWLKYLNQMEADSILRKEYEEIKTWIGNDIN